MTERARMGLSVSSVTNSPSSWSTLRSTRALVLRLGLGEASRSACLRPDSASNCSFSCRRRASSYSNVPTSLRRTIDFDRDRIFGLNRNSSGAREERERSRERRSKGSAGERWEAAMRRERWSSCGVPVTDSSSPRLTSSLNCWIFSSFARRKLSWSRTNPSTVRRPRPSPLTRGSNVHSAFSLLPPSRLGRCLGGFCARELRLERVLAWETGCRGLRENSGEQGSLQSITAIFIIMPPAHTRRRRRTRRRMGEGKSLYFQFEMKAKNISFADVLKNRNKSSLTPTHTLPTLTELFSNFQRAPLADYTLRLGAQRSRKTELPRCSAQSREDVFDSWIQRQSSFNKENLSQQPRRHTAHEQTNGFETRETKQNKESRFPTKSMAGTRRSAMEQAHTWQQDYRSLEQPEKPTQMGILEGKNAKSGLRGEFHRITEKKIEEINSLLCSAQQEKESHSLDQLIASTEHIHTDIAALARQYQQQQQQQQQPQPQPLPQLQERRSQEDEEQLLQSESDAQSRRWEEAKNMVSGFFNQLNKQALPIPAAPSNPSEESHFHLHVGYSFAVNSQPAQITPNQPIEHISEIQSERNSQRISDSGYFDFARQCPTIPNQNNTRTEGEGLEASEAFNSKELRSEGEQKTGKEKMEIEEIILREPSEPFSTRVLLPRPTGQKLSIVSSNKGKSQEKSNKASPSAPPEKQTDVVTTVFSLPHTERPPEPENSAPFETLHPKKSIKDIKTSIISPLVSPMEACPPPTGNPKWGAHPSLLPSTQIYSGNAILGELTRPQVQHEGLRKFEARVVPREEYTNPTRFFIRQKTTENSQLAVGLQRQPERPCGRQQGNDFVFDL